MPVISRIGRRSLKVRLIIGTIYFVLFVGSASMLYPFFLMLSGSVKSAADINNITPYPRYWVDDTILFHKYAESKYGSLEAVEISWQQTIHIWNEINEPAENKSQLLNDFLEWRSQCKAWRLGHVDARRLLAQNGREFRKLMKQHFQGDVARFAKEMVMPIKSWTELVPPIMDVSRYNDQSEPLMAAFLDFAKTSPIEDRKIFNLDGHYFVKYIRPKYTSDIVEYNKAHNTDYPSYRQVFLAAEASENPLERKDWEDFARKIVPLEFVRLSQSVLPDFQRFLAKKFRHDIAEYNASHRTNYSTFEQIPLSQTSPADRIEQVDWMEFLKDSQACPTNGISIHGPRQDFELFLSQKYSQPIEEITPVRMPLKAADYHDCMAHSRQLRWEFTTRNYKQVFDYVFVQSRGIINTIIYCSLAVGLALIVNPLAAYALSRYKPPSTYTILMICMATMAFPAEVTMIPGFLLLKRFPLWPLLGGGLGCALTIWLLSKFARGLSENLQMFIGAGTGVLVGAFVIPMVMMGNHNITLLNSFAALVLPGMANGYSIFLLKGFFDSLPRELYEAADLDGASEWTKFWALTMNLSKPILAVIALAAFTAAYSQFMIALIIIPDPEMWTLMVWIFQLQSKTAQPVIYASLVVTAIPTFMIFVFCQGIIMRGIVVPVEK